MTGLTDRLPDSAQPQHCIWVLFSLLVRSDWKKKSNLRLKLKLHFKVNQSVEKVESIFHKT